jgi:hypothetical protein
MREGGGAEGSAYCRRAFKNFRGHDEKTLYQEITHSDWVPVAHTCNPSYSGGRAQEDRESKPA